MGDLVTGEDHGVRGRVGREEEKSASQRQGLEETQRARRVTISTNEKARERESRKEVKREENPKKVSSTAKSRPERKPALC